MSDDVMQNGVNTQEATEASPAENQPSNTQEAQADQPASSENDKVSQSVPYERFSEINNKNKELEKQIEELRAEMLATKQPAQPEPQLDPDQQRQEQEIREQLKKMGFISKDEIEQIEADRQLQNTLSNLESKYNGQDGRPKFNRREVLEYASKHQIGSVEGAYKLMHQDALIDYAIKQAQGKVKPVKSETSDGSGSAEAGTTRQDLVKAAQKGDKSSIRDLIKRAF